jgi:rare lipoprotein A (peptidoglycan hydrolase)
VACGSVEGREIKRVGPLPPEEFYPVTLSPTPAPKVTPHVTLNTAKPTPRPTKNSVAVKKPTLQGKTHSAILTGVASWYCKSGVSRCTRGYPSGMYAAIRKDLLYLRGKTVKVCSTISGTCIHVRIIDCNCGTNANLIDLYSTAFRALAPLSAGRISVKIFVGS